MERGNRTLLPEPVEPGSVIRIDPQVPHHAWAAGEEPAVAWMVIRDLTHTTAGTHLDLPRDVSLEVQSRADSSPRTNSSTASAMR